MKQKLGMKANRAELFSRFGILLIFALVVLVASLVSNRFLSTDNILSVFTQCTVIGVLSCGMTMLIVSGNTDLSAGSGVALAGVVCALVINTSGSWVLAVLATVAVMLLTSALQGILVSYHDMFANELLEFYRCVTTHDTPKCDVFDAAEDVKLYIDVAKMMK